MKIVSFSRVRPLHLCFSLTSLTSNFSHSFMSLLRIRAGYFLSGIGFGPGIALLQLRADLAASTELLSTQVRREREREREFFLTLRERRFFFSIVDAPLPLAAFLLFCCSTALGPAPRSRSVYLSCSARGTRTSSRRSRIGASSDSDCRERLFSSFRSLPATDGQANKERASEREREGAIAWGWFFLSPPDVLLLPPRSLPRAPLPRLRGSPNGVCRSSERAER